MSWRLELDLTVPLSRFELRLEWQTTEPELGLFGPSGAGKTTVLEAIAGLRRGVRGTIRVDGATWLDSARGVSLPPERRGVGYLPQDLLLFPHLDVLGNVTAGARRARAQEGEGAPFDPERVLSVLELTPLRRRPVVSLSGGERQRVALARAVCSAPRLLLLDEPLASLDRPLRRRILPYLIRLREEFNLPTLHISHDATEVTALCREVTVLDKGRVVARGAPRDVLTAGAVPRDAELEDLENVMRGRVIRIDGAVAEVSLAPGLTLAVPRQDLREGDEAILALRAEELILACGPAPGLSAQNNLPAEVVALREQGGARGHEGTVLVSARLEGSDQVWMALLTPRATARLGLREGTKVHLIFKAHATRLLGVLGRALPPAGEYDSPSWRPLSG